ncbi:MAG: DUF5946 family protein [Pseudomonadota bacterium]
MLGFETKSADDHGKLKRALRARCAEGTDLGGTRLALYLCGMTAADRSECPGCGALLPMVEGPVHRYMDGSPACFEFFTRILAYEYSDAALQTTHRMTVDTYAVQHPGADGTRRQIQSVGLHLARLKLQLDNPLRPRETNEVMLGLSEFKHSLERLEPPKRFSMTVADVVEFAGTSQHPDRVRAWALATWNDWSEHHGYISDWVKKRL